MCIGMALFEECVQALLLRIGDANLVEEGDELVFGNILHGIERWLCRRGIADEPQLAL